MGKSEKERKPSLISDIPTILPTLLNYPPCHGDTDQQDSAEAHRHSCLFGYGNVNVKQTQPALVWRSPQLLAGWLPVLLFSGVLTMGFPISLLSLSNDNIALSVYVWIVLTS